MRHPTQTFSLVLPVAVAQRFRQLADERHTTRAQLLREAATDWLRRQERVAAVLNAETLPPAGDAAQAEAV